LVYIKSKSQLLNYVYRLYRHHLGGGVFLPEKLNKSVFGYEVSEDSQNPVKFGEAVKPVSWYIQRNEKDAPIDKSYSSRLTQAVYKKLHNLVSSYGGSTRIVIANHDENNELLKQLMDEIEIPHFDLASIIDHAKMRSIKFPLNGHWNEYGHFLAGKYLFRLVKEIDIR
jgi:hypothetical protein